MEEKKVASKEELLQAKTSSFVDMEVPEWGGIKIRLMAMSATDTIEFMQRTSDVVREAQKLEDGAFLVDDSLIWSFMKSAVDENFNIMFSEEERETVMTLPFQGFVNIQKEIAKLNKLTVDMSEVIDDAKKDSGETADSNSPTDSPSNSEK